MAKKLRKPEVAQEQENPDTASAHEAAAERRAMEILRHRAAMDKLLKDRANSQLSLEFSDKVVFVRDGRNKLVARLLLDGHWAREVGHMMQARGCRNVGTRLSENARFTIRQAFNADEVVAQERAHVPGMEFDGEEF